MGQQPRTTFPPRAGASLRKFTAAEYHRMGEAGIFGPDERIELIEGRVVAMPPIGDRHMSAVMALTQELTLALQRRAIVSVQNAIKLPDETEPEPDVAVLAPQPGRYAKGKPRPADILLLVEVADSSLDYDRGDKRALYARNGIREYWVVNLVGDQVEVCRTPTPDGYASITAVGPEGTLEVSAVPGTTIAVRDILPER